MQKSIGGGGEVGGFGGEASPLHPPVDETLIIGSTFLWRTLSVLMVNPSRDSSLIRSTVYSSPNSVDWSTAGQYWKLLSYKGMCQC